MSWFSTKPKQTSSWSLFSSTPNASADTDKDRSTNNAHEEFGQWLRGNQTQSSNIAEEYNPLYKLNPFGKSDSNKESGSWNPLGSSDSNSSWFGGRKSKKQKQKQKKRKSRKNLK